MVTKEMIGAAHDICLKKGDFVLSANLLERIYLAMRDKAEGNDSAGWDAYEDLRKASDETFLELRQRVQELEELLKESYKDADEVLRPRIAELEKERDSAYKIADHNRAERDELTKELATARLENIIKYGVSHPEMYKSEYEERLEKQRDELLAAIALAMPVMDAHAGPSRLADFHAAIASIKEK